jgi:hypothetical protein
VVFAIVFASGNPNRLRATTDFDLDPLAPDDYALFHFAWNPHEATLNKAACEIEQTPSPSAALA